ncbi:hypothetical protein [Microbispora sp. GKU 823]|uniref:hypothetical protein n=1 Tax=Microbispora sp. GKU 823 TaxID=1652100 RepID=UPI0009A36005|nr:hypothetical protein [Microbispora sp. GKU 823]OPG13302.1 hypothetical protein B1L11_08570 [Microbispora sp. GKU 823]
MTDGLRWSRRAVLLAGGLLIAGCGTPARPTIESEDYESTGSNGKHLREILDRRATALTERDEKGYLADLDPSNAKLIQREKALFSNLRQFELQEVRFIDDRAFEQKESDGDLRFAPLIRITKLTADAGPGDIAPAETFSYRLRKKGDAFVITATRSNREKLGLDGPLADAPWNTDALRVQKVGSKVWLVGDKSVNDLDRYAAVTERELAEVERLWGDRLSYPGHVLFFTRDPANFRQWFGLGAGGNFNPDNLGYQIRTLGVKKDGQTFTGEFAASRIVVNLRGHQSHNAPPNLTIRHELTHAVSARLTMTMSFNDFGPPLWAVEGFARWTETIGNPAQAAVIRNVVANGVRAGKFRGTVPDSKTFYGRDIDFNYCLGSTVFSLAERLKGRDAAVELYASIIQHPDSLDMPFVELPVFEGISKRVLGMSAGSFRARWVSHVRNGG